jgi:diguanylate cyclase (GGDEF)-like protein
VNLEKILSSALLPTLPQVAVRLLEIAKQEDSEIKEVIEAIKMDPAITAKILKAANSSYFTFRTEINSIERAVPLLGTNVVSSLVLSFSLVDSITTNGPLARHYKSYWRESIAQAAAAETIGTISGEGISCENFLAGLLMDIGRLAMLRTLEQGYLPLLVETESENGRILVECERNELGFDHTDVGAGLLRKWGLDKCLVDCAKTHHDSLADLRQWDQAPYFGLLKTTSMASTVCDYLAGRQLGVSLNRIKEFGEAIFGLDHQQVQSMLDLVRQKIDSVAEMFSVDVSEMGTPQELLVMANEQLANLAIRQQAALSEVALRQQNEFEQAKQELETQNSQLREQAFLDALTGVYNRRFFDETLRKEILRCQREKSLVGLILLDIDHFKRLNDNYGHPFGDEVLQKVANALSQSLREADTIARYGGEEFVVIAHQPSPEGLTVLSERLRRSVEALELNYAGDKVSVTISVGAATMSPNCENSNEIQDNLIAMADRMLYKSKQHGRNQIHIDVLTPSWVGHDLPTTNHPTPTS